MKGDNHQDDISNYGSSVGERYGGVKQLEPVAPAGEFIMNYFI